MSEENETEDPLTDFEHFVKHWEHSDDLEDLLIDISMDNRWNWNWNLDEMISYLDSRDYIVDVKYTTIIESMWRTFEMVKNN